MASHLRESLEERIHKPPHFSRASRRTCFPSRSSGPTPRPTAARTRRVARASPLAPRRGAAPPRSMASSAAMMRSSSSDEGKALRRHLGSALHRLARHRVHLRQLGVEGDSPSPPRAHRRRGRSAAGRGLAEALGARRELEVDRATRRPSSAARRRASAARGRDGQHRPLVELALRELADPNEEVGVVVRRREAPTSPRIRAASPEPWASLSVNRWGSCSTASLARLRVVLRAAS